MLRGQECLNRRRCDYQDIAGIGIGDIEAALNRRYGRATAWEVLGECCAIHLVGGLGADGDRDAHRFVREADCAEKRD